MKKAEDFRKAMGETEETFRFCVRQTLNTLMQREEEPVKKKLSVGLVLAMVLVLLGAVGAMAAGNWGILGYLEQQGKTPTQDMLEINAHETVYFNNGHDLVTMTVEEGLYEEDMLYLAMTVKPLEESTLVVPLPKAAGTYRTDEITMNAAMGTDAYAQDMTVLDYARDKGFEHVVLLETPTVSLGTLSPVAEDTIYVNAAVYDLQEDGSLRMILQKRFVYEEDYRFPEKVEQVTIASSGYKSNVADNGAWLFGVGHIAMVDYKLFESDFTRRSLEDDAHDIVGYRGFVKGVSITPYDRFAAVTIRLDRTKLENDHSWMSGPNWAVLDEEGNRLCYVEIKLSYPIYDDLHSTAYSEFWYGTIPLEYMPAGDTLTLQAENWNNKNIIYDTYTYTLD